ncbi:MAG: proton-conducting transporter transmembrane domain-containing protein, partial [Gammaproteobacteria bacterium]
MLAGTLVWFLNPAAHYDVLIFASGIVPAWILGLAVLMRLLKHADFAASPFVYRAMAEAQPKLSLLLFLSFLGMVGFPISPAFLGEDLLLAHASSHDPWFALPITIAFVINGIACARMYQRICMGRPSELNDAAEGIVTELQHP